MRKLLQASLEVPPEFVGAVSVGITVLLQNINSIIGIFVGIASITYLVTRIRKEMKEKK